MNHADEIEYKILQIKIRQLEEKIIGWERQGQTIRHMTDLLKTHWAEAVKREKEIQVQYGIRVASKAAP